MRNPSFSELEIGFCLQLHCRVCPCVLFAYMCAYVCVVCGMCGFDAGSHSSRADKIGRTGAGGAAVAVADAQRYGHLFCLITLQHRLPIGPPRHNTGEEAAGTAGTEGNARF